MVFMLKSHRCSSNFRQALILTALNIGFILAHFKTLDSISNYKKERKRSYQSNGWCDVGPTDPEPRIDSESDHQFNIVVKLLGT